MNPVSSKRQGCPPNIVLGILVGTSVEKEVNTRMVPVKRGLHQGSLSLFVLGILVATSVEKEINTRMVPVKRC
jgi:hypothetical protein